MNILAWNIRGVANDATIQTLKELRRQHKPDITLLFETRCSGARALEVISTLGFKFYFIEEANGFSGGIWALWENSNLKMQVIEKFNQCIHLKIEYSGEKVWTLSAVYASPQENLRKIFFENLKDFSKRNKDPWMLIGDFNEIKNEGEKKGGRQVDMHACRRFRDWMDDCKLLDLGFVGTRFTWKGGQRVGLDRVFKRLDRAISTSSWRTLFGDARIEVLPRVNSDHHPLLAVLRPEQFDGGEKPFRFEAMWSIHPDFFQFISGSWDRKRWLPGALKELAVNLKRWNRNKEKGDLEQTERNSKSNRLWEESFS
ncbi:hypothetical protein Ahy_B03g063314 [Arachis hypogaea]|uniref:Endonuclease/exonuclease/phosphatase domain-containing protein n=1 Tax=Arachis hypogaea TaxID=3818 RepID=A0A444ZXE9_ARAHY|nr:hypothetical protein Ahy_B03g063314 [Arachis hypogaea]